MNSKPGRQARWTVVWSASAALLVTGCVENGGPLLIVQNQIPEITDEGCIIPANRTELRRAQGIYDVALDRPRPYDMYPLVVSELPAIPGSSTEPNRVVMTGFEVEIEPPTTIQVAWRPSCPSTFDFPFPSLIDPGDQVATYVEAIRPCHGQLFRELFEQGALSSSLSETIYFRAKIRAKGRHGGTHIKSDPFEFPIRVCYGCLQTGFLLSEFADYSFPTVPNCSNLVSNPYIGNLCNPAQDLGPILCCARDGNSDALECPGVPRP